MSHQLKSKTCSLNASKKPESRKPPSKVPFPREGDLIVERENLSRANVDALNDMRSNITEMLASQRQLQRTFVVPMIENISVWLTRSSPSDPLSVEVNLGDEVCKSIKDPTIPEKATADEVEMAIRATLPWKKEPTFKIIRIVSETDLEGDVHFACAHASQLSDTLSQTRIFSADCLGKTWKTGTEDAFHDRGFPPIGTMIVIPCSNLAENEASAKVYAHKSTFFQARRIFDGVEVNLKLSDPWRLDTSTTSTTSTASTALVVSTADRHADDVQRTIDDGMQLVGAQGADMEAKRAKFQLKRMAELNEDIDVSEVNAFQSFENVILDNVKRARDDALKMYPMEESFRELEAELRRLKEHHEENLRMHDAVKEAISQLKSSAKRPRRGGGE